MKKFGLLAVASIAALVAGGALAADLPSRKAAPAYVPPPPPPPLWTGFYAGLNLGGGWTNSTINPNQLTPYVDTNNNIALLPGNTQGGGNAGGVIGGGQIGYNYQFGNSFLVGVETDFQGTSMNSSTGNANNILYPDNNGGFYVPLIPGGNRGISLNWFGTVRGRAGFLVMPTLLVYGTGGFAYGGVQGGVNGNANNTRTGWTAGGGVEWMFMPNWSAKAEYLYTDLNSGGATVGPWGNFQVGANRNASFNTVRAGVNYHFNFGGAAPVVAKY